MIEQIRAIWSRRDLVNYFVRTQLKILYKHKVLGFLWTILDPLMMMLVYVVLVVFIFQRGGPQFPILLFSTLLAWRWFIYSLSGSVTSITKNARLIQTVSFPKIVFPLSGVIVGLINFLLGLILAPIVAGTVGVLMERSVIRFLYGRRDLSTLLATWGFGMIFQQVVKLLFGPQPARVPSPLPDSIHFLGITYPMYRVFAMFVCLFVVIGVIVLFFKTDFGVKARATIQNREMAEVLGINTKRMYLFAFGFGAALAGVSGALIAPQIGVIPTMGLDFIARAFFIVIVGGMGSITGVLGSGFILGETENIITAVSNGTIAQIFVFIVVIVLMLIKPRGLFTK